MRDREETDGKDSEVTLSPASLLGIFLGLVLVCGVFFGFGYSVGRRTPGGSVPTATDSDADTPDTPASPIAKPSAARMLDSDGAASTADSASSGGSDTLVEPAGPAPLPAPVLDAPAPANAAEMAPLRVILNHAEGAKSAPAPAGALQEATDNPPTIGRTVVQVAAVTHQEDADVLASALRQRGYRVMERNEPQDKLLHVQVGPFSSREDANAMKQKLLADGYNAIIKQ